MQGAPNSYQDPYWTQLARSAGEKAGLPPALLGSIVNYGERSNNDQVSSAGARTPFQITPSTRQAILDKYGIDPYLSPENAADSAALLLKDSLDRNGGSIGKAVAEYHGGTDRKNWGPKTMSYVNRVLNGQDILKAEQMSEDFGKWAKENLAYDPAKAANAKKQAAEAQNVANSPPVADLSEGFIKWAKENPNVINKYAKKEPEKEPGVLDNLKEAITGNERATPTTQSLPDWAGMPELSDFSSAGAKTALGTIFAQPAEIAQIIKSNYPNAQVRQDEKGNYVIRSSIDGKEYAIKPGLQWSDLPRFLAGLGVFSPAAKATTIAGSALAGAGTQATIEATKAATGGNFDAGNVALTGLVGGVVPPAIAGVKAVSNAIASPVKAALSKLTGAAPQVEAASQALSQDVAQGARAAENAVPATAAVPESSALNAAQATEVAPASVNNAPMVQSGASEAAPIGVNPNSVSVPPSATVVPTAAPALQAAEVTPMTLKQTAKTATKAAEGGIGSKKALESLADQAAPNKKTVEAAQRLGVEQDLQPDHVTTNQVYRELSQAAKSIPGSAAHADEIKGLANVAKRADDLITQLGGTHDFSDLSQHVQKNLQNIRDNLETKANDYYDQLKQVIPREDRVFPQNTRDWIEQQAQELGGTENLSSLQKNVWNKLVKGRGVPADYIDPQYNILQYIQEGKARGMAPSDIINYTKRKIADSSFKDQPTYALLDQVRRDVGDAARMRGPFSDANTGEAKKLYSIISADQEQIAKQYGVSDLFNQAKATVQLRKSIEDDITSLFGKNLSGSLVGDLDRSIKLLSSGDTSKFIQMIQAIPKDMRPDVVASGLATAFGKSSKNQAINFNSYARWYEGLLKNKRAHAAIMTNLPTKARKQLSDLYRVSSDIAKASKERITTGRLQSAKEAFEGGENLIGKAYDLARRKGVAMAAGGATSLISPKLGVVVASILTKGPKTPAIEAVDKLLVSPEFKKAVVQASHGKAQVAAKQLAKSPVFSNFVFKLEKPGELTNRERWILQALEAKTSRGQNNEPKQQVF